MLDFSQLLTRLALAAGVLVVIGAMFASTKILSGPWWPSVAFQIAQRPRLFTRWLWGTLALSLMVGSALADVAGLYAALILWIIGAPRFLSSRANKKAWQTDHEDTRQLAIAVRNRERERLGQQALDGTGHWPQYIIDAARAERQKTYQEQFETKRGRSVLDR